MLRLTFLLTAICCAQSVVASGPRVVYPYRFDASDHPDNRLRHYPCPSWSTVDGRLARPDALVVGDLNKITRIAGVDKNSFPANLDLEAEHVELDRLRREYGDQYLGRHIGESDAGFIHFNRFYEYPFSRLREYHAMSYADFLDSYGRITDYQLSWGMNMGAAHAAFSQGYLTRGGFQLHHPQPYQVVYALLRGAAKQYGVALHGGLTDTYQKSTEAFRQKNLEDHELAKRRLAAKEADQVTWKDKFDVMATLRRANEAIDPDGSPFSYSYRFWHAAYQYNLLMFRHLEGLRYRDTGKTVEEREKTELGVLYDQFECRLLGKYPNPGGMYVPVALLVDPFNGWIGKDDGVAYRDYEGIAWDGVPFDRTDYQLGCYLQAIYPRYRPLLTRKSNEDPGGGFSETPFGDCADVLTSDARPELLRQYGLVVAAGEFQTELTLVRKKLLDYARQGGRVLLTRSQYATIFPDEAAPASPLDSNIVFRSGSEPRVIERPFGEGTIAVCTSNDGLKASKDAPQGSYAVELEDCLASYLQGLLLDLQLFSVGDGLAYVVNRAADGLYTLGVYNGQYHPMPFHIESHIGEIESCQEVSTGDVHLIQADARFYAPREIPPSSWGRSSDRMIGGGEVRMFHLRVAEQGVRVLDRIDYPERPKRYLAMDVRNLRRNIQLRPSFFQLFQGVKLDGMNLLDADDEAIEYEAGWFRVRHLDMVVDARGIDSEERLLGLLGKMSRLPYARQLVTENRSDLVAQQAEQLGVALRRPDEFRWVSEPTFTPSRPTSPVILNLAYDDWELTCEDVGAIEANSDAALHGMPLDKPTGRTPVVMPGKPFLHLRRIDDLRSWLMDHPAFFEAFSGVVVDSDYVYQMESLAWLSEAEWLKQHKLAVVVDFTDRTKMYRDLSYQRAMPLAALGRSMFQNVLSKMGQSGVMDAIIAPPSRQCGKREMAAMSEFADMAASHSVDLHLRMIFSLTSSARVAAALQQVARPNVHVACNPLATESDLDQLPCKLMLLASVDSQTGALLPICGRNVLGVPHDKTVIFDAEYIDWDEIRGDVAWWTSQRP